MWSIWVETSDTTLSGHPEVWIEHGQVDGKKQLTNDVISEGVNVGKANETTPLEQALLTLERKVTKQKEHGYSESIEESESKEVSFNFSEPFPKELCFYKPKNSIDEKKIQKLESAGRAMYTVKRDGMMHIIRKTKELGVEIYSRRMDLVTDKYPHLVRALGNLPDDTILLGEIIFVTEEGKDNFNLVSSICRSDPEEALAKQKEFGNVWYYIFDVAYFKGANLLTTKKYKDRRKTVDATFTHYFDGIHKEHPDNHRYVTLAEIIDKSHAEAMVEIKKRTLEGLVIWDAEATMEDGECFTMNGKAYRPNVLWKSKPKYEDDFIVKFDPANGIGEFGKGKNNNKVRSVFCYQLDDDGNEVYLGNCGGGLSDEQRTFYTEEATYPRVWRIEYDSIQAKTGSLRFPVFNADRTLIGDKTYDECLMSDAIKRARQEQENE